MPTGRRTVNFRASWKSIAVIEQLAKDEGVVNEDGEPNRSEMLRILLAYAVRHRPKGWRP